MNSPNPHEVRLNCIELRDTDHFFDAIFQSLGSPDWHGRNLDALADSLLGAGINKLEAPIHFILERTACAGLELREFFSRVLEMIDTPEFAENGVTIEARP